MQRVHEQVTSWLQHPTVKPAPSANQAAQVYNHRATTAGQPDEATAVWQSPGGTTSFGMGIPTHPMYALQIAEPTVPADAPTVIALAGNHPGEHLVGFTLEGLVDWWIGDSAEAKALRQSCRLLVYPMVNPDGRYGGYVRGTLALPQGDHNRLWSPEDTNVTSTIACVKAAMAYDCQQGGPIEFFLDFHSQERPDATYMYVNTTMHYREGTKELLPFLARMHQDIPGFYGK